MNREMPEKSGARKPGRSRGGDARALALPAKRRSEIGKKGAAVRWDPNVRMAQYGDDDHPLILGGVGVLCYVLDNEERVLSQRGFFEALGLRSSGSAMERLIKHTRLDAYLPPETLDELRHPLRMRQPRGGSVAFSYRGPLLIDVCEALLTSFEHETVDQAYKKVAIRAHVIVRAVAKVGIIALIDEATGYEKKRAANSLAEILEAFIAKELQPWVKTFPDEFYSELFRLRNLPFPSGRVQRPQFFGNLTNDIVYRRLAPGVLEELKRVAPRNAKGKRSGKLFQMLSASWGYRKLLEHMGAVITMMQLSTKYEDFKRTIDRLRPVYGTTLPLPFAPGELDDDNGVGL
jgi:hypothetical protein